MKIHLDSNLRYNNIMSARWVVVSVLDPGQFIRTTLCNNTYYYYCFVEAEAMAALSCTLCRMPTKTETFIFREGRGTRRRPTAYPYFGGGGGGGSMQSFWGPRCSHANPCRCVDQRHKSNSLVGWHTPPFHADHEDGVGTWA